MIFPPNELVVYRHLLPRKPGFVHKNGKYDYVGQFLVQMGYDIPDGMRVPSELKQVIRPFIFKCRLRYVDTCLALQLMRFDTLHHTDQDVIDLMAQHNYKVEFEK